MDIRDAFNLNQKEMQQLGDILSKKNNKMTQKEKDSLLNKISNNTLLEEKKTNQNDIKDMKDMTIEEKTIYKNELKNKMKLKRNQMKNIRNPNYCLKNDNKNMEEKLAENINRLSKQIPNKTNDIIENNILKTEENPPNHDDEIFDDYVVL